MVAGRLKMTVGELEARGVGPVEFLRWRLLIVQEEKDKIKREFKTRHRVDWYLAQVAYEVYLFRVLVSNIGRKEDDLVQPDREFESFFLDLEKKRKTTARVPPPREEVQGPEMTEEERQVKIHEATVRSQSVWFAALGINPPGAPGSVGEN